MAHSLIMNYGLYKKMEIYVSLNTLCHLHIHSVPSVCLRVSDDWGTPPASVHYHECWYSFFCERVVDLLYSAPNRLPILR